MISIILPTYNEIRHQYLERILAQLIQLQGAEVILVDSGSTDGTLEVIKSFGLTPLSIAPCNRARRLNHGLAQARGEIVFLHHPRSLPDPAAFAYLERETKALKWGGLTHQFDDAKIFFRFTSWYSNVVRPRWQKVVYLDHCIFFRRSLLPGDDPVPEVDIFEDTLLSWKLAKVAPPQILPFASVTSATRFHKNGILKQALLNQVCKAALWLGVPLPLINRIYERALNFNCQPKV